MRRYPRGSRRSVDRGEHRPSYGAAKVTSSRALTLYALRKAIRTDAPSQASARPGVVEELGMCRRSMTGNREISWSASGSVLRGRLACVGDAPVSAPVLQRPGDRGWDQHLPHLVALADHLQLRFPAVAADDLAPRQTDKLGDAQASEVGAPARAAAYRPRGQLHRQGRGRPRRRQSSRVDPLAPACPCVPCHRQRGAHHSGVGHPRSCGSEDDVRLCPCAPG